MTVIIWPFDPYITATPTLILSVILPGITVTWHCVHHPRLGIHLDTIYCQVLILLVKFGCFCGRSVGLSSYFLSSPLPRPPTLNISIRQFPPANLSLTPIINFCRTRTPNHQNLITTNDYVRWLVTTYMYMYMYMYIATAVYKSTRACVSVQKRGDTPHYVLHTPETTTVVRTGTYWYGQHHIGVKTHGCDWERLVVYGGV